MVSGQFDEIFLTKGHFDKNSYYGRVGLWLVLDFRLGDFGPGFKRFRRLRISDIFGLDILGLWTFLV